MADANETYYYHFDGLGSVVALSDVNNVLVERYAYDVFGRPTIRDANGAEISETAVGNPYLFTGRRYDAETALYYYRARYYDYYAGRLLQPDPLGYVDSLNLYQYCLDNPMNLVDPSGLEIKDILGPYEDAFYREMRRTEPGRFMLHRMETYDGIVWTVETNDDVGPSATSFQGSKSSYLPEVVGRKPDGTPILKRTAYIRWNPRLYGYSDDGHILSPFLELWHELMEGLFWPERDAGMTEMDLIREWEHPMAEYLGEPCRESPFGVLFDPADVLKDFFFDLADRFVKRHLPNHGSKGES